MKEKKQTSALVLTGLFTAIIIIMSVTPLGYIPLGVINATIIHIPVILGALYCGPKRGAFLGFVFGMTSFIKNTVAPATLSAFVFSPVLAASQFGVAGVFKSAFICFVPRILVGVLPYFVYVLVRKLTTIRYSAVWMVLLNGLLSALVGFGVRIFVFNTILSGHKDQEGWDMAKVTGTYGVKVTVLAVVIAVILAAVLIVFTFKKSSMVLGLAYAGVSGAMTNTLLVMPSIYLLYKEAYAKATSVAMDQLVTVILGVISFNGVIEAIVAAVLVTAVGGALVKVLPMHFTVKKEG
ncbi:MAG: ECF transporter S component [Lachnospiraceae bacterium]|nr:ECF transporter S component [Lachnospiraceae bacterium]